MNHLSKTFLSLILLLGSSSLFAQNTGSDSRVIPTGAPFLTITPDARAGAMGDVGAATTTDVYSQYWNPSKYVFAENSSGLGISYTPWLSELVSDIFVGYVSGFYKINDNSAVGSSLRYFGLGEIQTTDGVGNPTGIIKPNEFSFDLSYSLRLDERFSMAIGLRYIQSNIAGGGYNSSYDVGPGRSVGVDIAGYYFSEVKRYKDFDGSWSFGWNISNVGPKMSYSENAQADQEYFLPANLRIGGGYNFKFDTYNELNVNIDANKLLVPTPPIYDEQGNIVSGMNPNVSMMQGLVQSFYDAPGGFEEEMQEIAWAFGAEYIYDKTFALRGGYFYEHPDKGNRQYATLGFGFYYNAIGLDFSYLMSTSQVRSPLENTLRFSLTIDFDSFTLLPEEDL